MPSESSKNTRTAFTGPAESAASHHPHRNGSSHRSSQVATAATNNGDGADMQSEHRGSERRHHSRHRHHSRSSPAPQSTRDAESHRSAAHAQATPASEADPLESSRASTRSSRLPARRSTRASVVGAGSTNGDLSFQEDLPHHNGGSGKKGGAAQAGNKAASIAPSSSANFPSTSELSAMMRQAKSTAKPTGAVATAVKAAAGAAAAAAAPSATHSASFSSSSYSSHEGDIDFHTQTQQDDKHKTSTSNAAAALLTHPSHSTSSINYYETSRQSTTHQPADGVVEAKATAPPPPPPSEPSRKSSHRSAPPPSQPQQAASAAPSKKSRHGETPVASVAPEKSARSSRHAKPEEGEAEKKSDATAAAVALAALKAAPQPDALVRSWQADVAPNQQDPPSSLAPSVCRGHDAEKGEADAEERSPRTSHRHRHHHHRHHHSRSSRRHSGPLGAEAATAAEEEAKEKGTSNVGGGVDGASARASHSRRGDAAAASEERPSSLHRDSRSSSHYATALQPPAAAAPTPSGKESAAGSAASPVAAASASQGRSPQRDRTSSTSRRPTTVFDPFQLNTERRSTVRRTSSPQAYTPRDPLRALSKEEQERLMGLPHEAFNEPGAWRLDMRFEEDRKEYFRRTHLIDPMTRAKPSVRQFYVPEQADLFGMYGDIPMTKDDEGNDIVAHFAPIPIAGESFVKPSKPYAAPRPSAPRKEAAKDESSYPPPPAPAAESVVASQDTSTSAGGQRRGSRGLAGLVWGYGEEASGRRGGLTPPRGRVVSDITAPYRRNPAMSTGQIGCHGGDGTLNIFRMSEAEDVGEEGGIVNGSTPPQSARARRWDTSPASTNFAVMQPTPTHSIPTTTNSDYGLSHQLYAEAAMTAPSPHAPSDMDDGSDRDAEEEAQAAPPRHRQNEPLHSTQRGPPPEAVVLQPSVGGYSSSSRSLSEAAAAPRSITPTASLPAPPPLSVAVADPAAAAAPPSIQTGEDARSATSALKPKAAEDYNASERSSRKKDTVPSSRTSVATATRATHGMPEAEAAAVGGPVPLSATSSAAAAKAHPQRSTADTNTTQSSRCEVNPAAAFSPVTAEKPSKQSTPAASSQATPAPSVAHSTANRPAAAAAPTPAVTPPPLSKTTPSAPTSITAASSELQTPTSAKPDPAFPIPSPAPQLPASSSARISRERHPRPAETSAASASSSSAAAAASGNGGREQPRQHTRPERASAAAEVPPPLPPAPSSAPATAPPSSIRTHEASISMTDVASTRDGHRDPTAMRVAEHAVAAAAASAAPSHRFAEAVAVVKARSSAPSAAPSSTAGSSASLQRWRERNATKSVEREENKKEEEEKNPATPRRSTAATSTASSAAASTTTKRSTAVVDAAPPPPPPSSGGAAAAAAGSGEVRSLPASSHRSSRDISSSSSSISHRSDSKHDHHYHQEEEGNRHSVRSRSSVSESAVEGSQAHSSAFSCHHYAEASGESSPATSVREGGAGSNSINNINKAGSASKSSSVSGFRSAPRVLESGTQTDFVFVLDPLQGRQFVQREEEQQQLFLDHQHHLQQRNVLRILDTRRSSSGIFSNLTSPRQSQSIGQQQQQTSSVAGRSASPSEQRPAGLSTGVSPTRRRRTGYANTSTHVRDLLRWN